MAYSFAEVSLFTHVGKEAFAAALNDGKQQMEVMKRDPQNVGAALSHAIKLEAFEQLLACQGAMVDHDDSRAKRWPQTVCAVAESPDASETAALHKCVDELQEALAQATKGIAALATGPWSG